MIEAQEQIQQIKLIQITKAKNPGQTKGYRELMKEAYPNFVVGKKPLNLEQLKALQAGM